MIQAVVGDISVIAEKSTATCCVLDVSGKLNTVLLRFRRGPPSHATSLLQTDSERVRRTRKAPRLSKCRWMLNENCQINSP